MKKKNKMDRSGRSAKLRLLAQERSSTFEPEAYGESIL